MKLATLNKLFQAENPTGHVVRDHGSFTVWFRSDSKGYNYNAASIYALAERLGLIPDVDIPSEARVIVAMLKTLDCVIAPAGCGDTCRQLWEDTGTIMEHSAGLDEFDRPLSRYFINHNDRWSCSQ